MSRYRDIMATIEAADQINPNYDISLMDARKIIAQSDGDLDMVHNGFRFGFLQGMKAVRAEMKGGAVV